MMKADKSFEPDATAAFKKLKQKQQVGNLQPYSFAICGGDRHFISCFAELDVEKKARRKSLMLERITEGKSRVQMKTTKRRMVLSPVANW